MDLVVHVCNLHIWRAEVRQKDCCKFKAGVLCTVSTSQPGKHSESLPKPKQRKQNKTKAPFLTSPKKVNRPPAKRERLSYACLVRAFLPIRHWSEELHR